VSYDTIILVGNGSSLNQVTDEFLDAYPTFGCNWIHKRMLPTYYTVYGQALLDTEERRLAHQGAVMNAERAFVNEFHRHNYSRKDIMPLRSQPDYTPGEIAWSYNPHLWVGVYQTVLYTNLQLIYWLGFRRVFIVGLDHDYGGANRHFYPDDELTLDHVIDDKGENERQRRLADLAFAEARKRFEANGREILNLTPRSDCTAFRKVMYV